MNHIGLRTIQSLRLPAAPLLLLFFPDPTRAQIPQVFPGDSWQSAAAHDVGLDSLKLKELQDHVGGSGMIVRFGYEAWTWGDVSAGRDWASASKPVLSTFLFMAVDRGLCTVESTMGQFHEGGSEKDRNITFHQLANNISGYSRAEGPGEAWAYNDYAINLYGYTLCYKVFGNSPSSVFADRLSFLQFEDGPEISNSQYGRIVDASLRDFALIGVFWQTRGNWNGSQIIPASYFDALANTLPPDFPQSTADGPESWDFGTAGGSDNQDSEGPGHYSYNFWVNSGGFWPGVPADAIQANGQFGEIVCVVIPSLSLVAVGSGNWRDPSTEAIQLLVEAAGRVTSIQPSSWGKIKERYPNADQ